MALLTHSPPGALGSQRPRIASFPDAPSSAGREVVELSAYAGLPLDPWQEFVVEHSMGMKLNEKWASFEVGVCVPRQNGKGGILTARQLAGLFLFGDELQIHSAHQFDTSMEAFLRLKALIEDKDEFSRRIRKFTHSHGEEGITLTNGQRIRFRTRTKGGGRGFSSDTLYLDEAMELSETAHSALLPTLSARPNGQIWYAGSAVDQNVHEHGTVFARVRKRGVAGDDDGLSYFEWSPDVGLDDVDDVAGELETWAEANPALGIRIEPDFVKGERRSLSARGFAVERLGVGDWPKVDEDADEEGNLTIEMWERVQDERSVVMDPVRLAVDVRPDRSKSAVAIAGYRQDGRRHVEIVEHKSGTDWVAARCKELQGRWGTSGVIYDTKSPANALLPKFVELGVKVTPVGPQEMAAGCGMLFDDVVEDAVRHLGTPELASAVRGAARRPLGDSWAWSRKTSTADICPLVAVTLARWALGEKRPSSTPLVAWR